MDEEKIGARRNEIEHDALPLRRLADSTAIARPIAAPHKVMWRSRGAAQAADDVLRVTYLDLARRWRKMAHEAESLERKAAGPTKSIPRTAEQVFALSGSGPQPV